MAKPDARPTGGEPPTNILPLMQGNVRDERFVLSADTQATSLYVQFDGWIVEWDVQQMLAESYAEIYGVSPDDDDMQYGDG